MLLLEQNWQPECFRLLLCLYIFSFVDNMTRTSEDLKEN